MKANVKRINVAKDYIYRKMKNECDKARNIGIAAGAKTMATVIIDILNGSSSDQEKLEKIKNFCNTCVANNIEKDLSKDRKEDKI